MQYYSNIMNEKIREILRNYYSCLITIIHAFTLHLHRVENTRFSVYLTLKLKNLLTLQPFIIIISFEIFHYETAIFKKQGN